MEMARGAFLAAGAWVGLSLQRDGAPEQQKLRDPTIYQTESACRQRFGL